MNTTTTTIDNVVMHTLFADAESSATTTRTEAGALLIAAANETASQVISAVTTNLEEYFELCEQSKADNNAMDELVRKIVDIDSMNVDYLALETTEALEKLLKSQQSKRSRSKAGAMTKDNYRNLVSGAVGELLIRRVLGKGKSATVGRRAAGSLDYTDEMLATFKADQLLLRKEIRNVQSKKSIMKAKDGFVETDERWIELLDAEQKLKDLRVAGDHSARIVYVDTTRDLLIDSLNGADVDSLKAAEARELLKKLLQSASIAAENEVETAAEADEIETEINE